MIPELLHAQAVWWCESLHAAVARSDRGGFTLALASVKDLLELPTDTDRITTPTAASNVFEVYEQSTSRALALATIDVAARTFGDGWDLERTRSIEELVDASYGVRRPPR